MEAARVSFLHRMVRNEEQNKPDNLGRNMTEEAQRLKLRGHIVAAILVIDGLFLSADVGAPKDRKERFYYVRRTKDALQLAIEELEAAKKEVTSLLP